MVHGTQTGLFLLSPHTILVTPKHAHFLANIEGDDRLVLRILSGMDQA